jgi:2,3-bisphosphoglycerate-independent phosphoglycerate mutase
MTQYDEARPLPHLFAPQAVPDNLAEWLARLGMSQLHVAETEKYAHVTFFFNGGVESALDHEDRVLVPSPNVATYDTVPEMSAPAITKIVGDAIEQDRYDFILVNYANCDMVGHTGDLESTRAAVRAVDDGIRTIAERVLHAGGLLVITADHGNAEHMRDSRGGPDTNHTAAPVPLVLVGVSEPLRLRPGGLKDVAPTLLAVAGLPIPAAMQGEVLVQRNGASAVAD